MDRKGYEAEMSLALVARGPGACPSADTSSGRGPQDTSSAQRDEVDCGKAGDAKRRSPPAPCVSRSAATATEQLFRT